MPKYSEYPSFHIQTGKGIITGFEIRCEDRVITVKPCGPGSETGPDGSFPYIELEDGEEKKAFALSSKRRFDSMFDDLATLDMRRY